MGVGAVLPQRQRPDDPRGAAPRQATGLWRRPFTKPSEGGIVQGLDPSLAGYDFNNLGYRYDKVPCTEGDVGAATAPVLCKPRGTPLSVVEGELSKLLGPDLWAANQEPLPLSEDDRQRRMIYNTNEFSMGNKGHEFTRVLDDREVDAILEYLKTL